MSTKKNLNLIQRVDDMGNVEKTLPESSASLAVTLPQSQKYTTTYASNPTGSSFNYKTYIESPVVSEKYKLLQNHLGLAPTYNPSKDANGLTYKDKLASQLEAILGRKDFKYDLNADMLYQQYKDMYTNQAKMGSADAMGQAAAMTGGYGNSYAQSVGQQMYQKQMQGLNDIIPELYQMALDKYNAEGQTLLDEYSLLADAEDREYSKFMDDYNLWLGERDRLADAYYNERDFDYTKYADDKSYAYASQRESAADKLASEKAVYDYKEALSKNGYTLDKDGNIVPIEDEGDIATGEVVDLEAEAKTSIRQLFGWDKSNKEKVWEYLMDLTNVDDEGTDPLEPTTAKEIYDWWLENVKATK